MIRALRRSAIVALSAALLTGCSEETAAEDAFVVATSITVDPDAFLGDLACDGSEGSPRAYVATVTDQTDPSARFTLPSSPPTSCGFGVHFRNVIPGHVYTAEVDGYPLGVDELEPFGGRTSGARTMLRGGEPVAPTWRWACSGEAGAGGAVARFQASAVIGSCVALDTGAPSVTAIYVDVSAAVAELGCGAVPTVEITPLNGGLVPRTVACGAAPAQYTFTQGVEADVTYELRLTATVGGALHASRCSARAREGRTVVAACAPLTSIGALEVDLGGLMSSAGKECDLDVASFDAIVKRLGDPAGVVASGPIGCDAKLSVGSLQPGLYGVDLVALAPSGEEAFSATCSAVVEPAETTRAACQISP